MFNQTKFTLIVALLATMPVSVQAQEDRGGTKWGPFRALPRIDLDYISTDNYFNEETRGQATGLLKITPGLGLEAGTGTMKYILDGDIEHGEVTRSHDDNYTDLHLSAQAIYQPTSRAMLDLSVGYQKEHDDRGTNRTEANPTLIRHPDEYDQTDIGGTFTYGVADAKGQITLSMDHTNIEYTNNRAGTRPRDRDEDGLGAIFKWRVAPKTRIFVEGRYRDFDYDSLPTVYADTTTLDSDDERYFVGVEWEATYKTTGTFQVGHMEKDFDSATRRDVDEGSWEAAIEWKPRSYSVVNVSTGRTFGESNGTGDVTLTDFFTVAWDHEWRDRLSTTLSYKYAEDEYPGSTTATLSEREDEIDIIAFEANYEMRRWLTLGAGFEHEKKDSNRSAFDYDRNNVFVNARMRF